MWESLLLASWSREITLSSNIIGTFKNYLTIKSRYFEPRHMIFYILIVIILHVCVYLQWTRYTATRQLHVHNCPLINISYSCLWDLQSILARSIHVHVSNHQSVQVPEMGLKVLQCLWNVSITTFFKVFDVLSKSWSLKCLSFNHTKISWQVYVPRQIVNNHKYQEWVNKGFCACDKYS